MRWIIAVLGMLAGVAMGLGYGWKANPVKFSDTTLASLRIDYRTDYVLMVAESFDARQDLAFARRQLALLGSESYTDMCNQAFQEARQAGYSPADLDLLQELLRAMRTYAPATAPGGAPP